MQHGAVCVLGVCCRVHSCRATSTLELSRKPRKSRFSRLKLHCDEYINHARVSELVNAKRQGSLSLQLCAKCQSPRVTCVYSVGQRRSQIQRAFL